MTTGNVSTNNQGNRTGTRDGHADPRRSPARDVTGADIHQLFRSLAPVSYVRLINNGNHDSMMACVAIEADYAVASTIAWWLDGTRWHNRHLEATLTPYSDG